MDYLELQRRANVLVNKVNAYETSLKEETVNEEELLAQHKYADIHCLRPVMKLLFGKNISEKLNRTLDNDIDLQLYASSAPANNVTFSIFKDIYGTNYQSSSHTFLQNLDMINAHNMLQLDVLTNEVVDRDTRISQGINYSYSANISDALVTESQVASIFKWNTTSSVPISNNVRTINRQVPGIVCYYLGNDYNSLYTATIPYVSNPDNINSINYNTPPYYGAYYTKKIETSQVGELMQAECCRIFLPGMNYTRGKLESPQQIWQPDVEISSGSNGYNWQGQAIYHELVYKDLRKSCLDAGLDFTPDYSETVDNDPQGLALRLALSKQKDYYYNRPWFTELDDILESPKAIADRMQTIKSTGYEKAEFVTLLDNMSIDFDTGNIVGFINNINLDWNIKVDNLANLIPGATQYTIHLDFIHNSYNSNNGWLFRVIGVGGLLIDNNNFLKIYRESDGGYLELLRGVESNSHFVCDFTINISSNLITNWTMDIDYHDGQKFTRDFSESIDITNLTTLGIDSGGNLSSLNGATSSISAEGTQDTMYLATKTYDTITELTDEEFYNTYKLDYKTYKGI